MVRRRATRPAASELWPSRTSTILLVPASINGSQNTTPIRRDEAEYAARTPDTDTAVFSQVPIPTALRLKRLSKHLPCRPVCVWAYLYFIRGGLLDGRAGLTYCSLRAIYEYMILLKARELRFRGSGKSV